MFVAFQVDYPVSNRHTAATTAQTTKPIANGNKAEMAVHFALRVSFQMV